MAASCFLCSILRDSAQDVTAKHTSSLVWLMSRTKDVSTKAAQSSLFTICKAFQVGDTAVPTSSLGWWMSIIRNAYMVAVQQGQASMIWERQWVCIALLTSILAWWLSTGAGDVSMRAAHCQSSLCRGEPGAVYAKPQAACNSGCCHLALGESAAHCLGTLARIEGASALSMGSLR